MTGPEGINVPAQTQAVLGAIKVSDLIGTDVKLAVSGNSVTVTGTIKNITEPWTEFNKKKDNTGHFFPMEMPKSCIDQKITVEGRADGNKTVTITEDRLLIQRLENLSGNVMTITMGEETLMVVDFGKAQRA